MQKCLQLATWMFEEMPPLCSKAYEAALKLARIKSITLVIFRLKVIFNLAIIWRRANGRKHGLIDYLTIETPWYAELPISLGVIYAYSCAVVLRGYPDYFLENSRKIVWILITNFVRNLVNGLVFQREQCTSPLHFDMDEIVYRRVPGLLFEQEWEMRNG